MNEKTKTVIKTVIVILLVIVAAYYSIKDVNPRDLWYALLDANYIWVIISIPIILLAHYLRALRWKIMLEPIIEAKSSYNLFKAVMIGYAANNITPRGGELLRPYIYSRQEKVSFTSVFGTIIVERFIDLLTLGALFAIALMIFSEKIIQALRLVISQLNIEIQPGNFIFLSFIILIVLITTFLPPVIDFFLKILVKPISQKFYERLNGLYYKFRKGFGIIKTPSRYLRLTIESISIWICYGLPMYIMFNSFGFQDSLHLGFGDAFLLLIVVGVSVTIAPTPGAIGVHHITLKTALMILYGLNEKEALAYAIVTHAINFIVNSIVGGYYYILEKKQFPPQKEITTEISTL